MIWIDWLIELQIQINFIWSNDYLNYERKKQVKNRYTKRIQPSIEATSDDSDSDSHSNRENYRQRYSAQKQLTSTCNMSSPQQSPPPHLAIMNHKYRYSDDDSQA